MAARLVASLAKQLRAGDDDARREAALALQDMAFAGKDLGDAEEALRAAVAGEPRVVIRGNAAIAFTLHLLATGRRTEAEALLDDETSSHVQCGAIWALAHHALEAGDAATLRELFLRLKPGLATLAWRDGLVAALQTARERGEDIGLAISVLHELLEKKKRNPVGQAPLVGILEALG